MVALFLVGVLAAVAVRAAEHDRGRVPPGVQVGGIDIGGLDRDAAERVLRRSARPSFATVEVRTPGAPVVLDVAALDPRPAARAAVDEAIAGDGYWSRFRRKVGLGETRRLPLLFSVPPPARERASDRVEAAVARPARSAAVRVEGGRIAVAPAVPGRRLDRAAFVRRLRALPPVLDAPTRSVPPPVTTAEATATARSLRALVRAPIRVTASTGTVALRRADLLELIGVQEGEGRLRLTVDREALGRRLEPLSSGIEREPRSAAFSVAGGRVTVTPSVTGRRVDLDATATALLDPPPARTVPLTVETAPPDLTTAEARAMRIQEVVGEFRTEYPCCAPRVTNIQRAAAILDGTVVPPGGRFSLNETLGERTRERGFLPAPQINAGRLEDAVGGGVSQVATTVFNAAFFAGMRLDSHTPHEFYISRYPPGREATISWGGPELIWTNDWPAGVLVTAEATDTAITVRLYSSRLGRRVTTTTSTPAGTAGAFPVRVTRRVLRGDQVVRDEEFTWNYREPPAE